jgi:hypothetical protein
MPRMFFTEPLPRSKKKRRGAISPVPSSTMIEVPDCAWVGGHGVLPGNDTRISPSASGSPGGK